MKTEIVNDKNVNRKWLVIDAQDLVMGRLATQVATLLKGKHKPSYSPSVDVGDNVVVVNASKIKLTGNKAEVKAYFKASTRPGKSSSTVYKVALEKDAAAPLTHAVKGMLPKNALGRRMIQKLYVYGGDSHPHAAQKPEAFEVK